MSTPCLPLRTRLTVASLTRTYFATSASLRVTMATVIAPVSIEAQLFTGVAPCASARTRIRAGAGPVLDRAAPGAGAEPGRGWAGGRG